MRKILVSAFVCLFSLSALAQAPEKMSYQAVVRDNANALVVDKVVGMRISILRGSVTGTAAYVETQSPRSNTNGLVTLEIGAGTVVSGSFVGLNWSSGPYFIQTEIDPSGGSNYSILGVSQLVSVPYALYAKTSGSSTPGPAGPAGAIGATGSIGPAGVAGAAGTNGTAGATGPQGIKGDTGATGPIGTTGATGTTGAVGPQGTKGDTGATGPIGPAGVAGTNGANGAVGSNGLNGKTVINGTSNPATGQGVIGDFYINTATNTLFGPKASGGWPTGVSLVGAAGIQGIQGAAGADGTNGATGAAGTNGTNGLDGKTVLNGTVDPTNQGVIGDFYINTATSTLFGPKASGGWPTGVSLVGAAGIQGIQGVPGVAGPAPSGTGIVTVNGGTLQTPSGLTGDVTTTGAGLATTIGTGAVTSNKILDGTIATADLANSAVTDEKIAGVAGSKVSGNITGNAANVTGTVAVVNGGTGATTLTGLVKGNGTDAMTAAVAGTDYQAPLALTTTGSGAATLTGAALNIPTLAAGTADGDMLYWNGTVWVKVAAGSNGQNLTFYNGAPTWTGTISFANTVVNGTTGKIWMDRNLGASQVATSSTDAASYGDLYQWGRGADGHQIRTSSITTTLSSSDQPGNGNFIVTTSTPNDWRSSKNDNLWQGVSGVNNPCPTGYRIPTEAEWNAERLSWTGGNNAAGALASPLKLPMAGGRLDSNGSLVDVGSFGYYWSSTVSGTDARLLYFYSSSAIVDTGNRAVGFSVRCLKD